MSFARVRLVALHHRPETAETFARDEALLVQQARVHRVEVVSKVLRRGRPRPHRPRPGEGVAPTAYSLEAVHEISDFLTHAGSALSS